MQSADKIELYRKLWRLGLTLEFIACHPRKSYRATPDHAALVKGYLSELEIPLGKGALPSGNPEKRRTGINALKERVAAVLAERHGADSTAIFMLAALIRNVLDFTMSRPDSRPSEQAVAAARSFQQMSEPLSEPAQSELEQLRGWCMAIEGGWFWRLEWPEFQALIWEAFEDPQASKVPEPLPATNFDDAPLSHVVHMARLYSIIRTMGSGMVWYGHNPAEGAYADVDQYVSIFVEWNDHGIVGLASHREAIRAGVAAAANRWLGDLPSELEQLLLQLTSRASAAHAGTHDYSAGFWITTNGRFTSAATGYNNGAEHFECLATSEDLALRGALTPEPKAGWFETIGISPEQGEVAVTLARRVTSGGGRITKDEARVMIEDPHGGSAHLMSSDAIAWLATLGLRWPRIRQQRG